MVSARRPVRSHGALPGRPGTTGTRCTTRKLAGDRGLHAGIYTRGVRGILERGVVTGCRPRLTHGFTTEVRTILIPSHRLQIGHYVIFLAKSGAARAALSDPGGCGWGEGPAAPPGYRQNVSLGRDPVPTWAILWISHTTYKQKTSGWLIVT